MWMKVIGSTSILKKANKLPLYFNPQQPNLNETDDIHEWRDEGAAPQKETRALNDHRSDRAALLTMTYVLRSQIVWERYINFFKKKILYY